MYISGSLYVTDSVHAAGDPSRWIVIGLTFIFALLYVSSWGIVCKIYASEIQPAETRAAANSIAQGHNFLSEDEEPLLQY